MTADKINAAFEAIGACLLLLNCQRLYRDKLVRGVHWAPIAFYMVWGIWNVPYYTMIGQVWSFRAGMLVVGANLLNLIMLNYYVWKEVRLPTCPTCKVTLFFCEGRSHIQPMYKCTTCRGFFRECSRCKIFTGNGLIDSLSWRKNKFYCHDCRGKIPIGKD